MNKRMTTLVLTALGSLTLLAGCATESTTAESVSSPSASGSRGALPPSLQPLVAHVCIRNDSGGPIAYDFVSGLYTTLTYVTQPAASGEIPKGEQVCGAGSDFIIDLKHKELSQKGTLRMSGLNRFASINGVSSVWIPTNRATYIESDGYRLDITTVGEVTMPGAEVAGYDYGWTVRVL